MRSFERASWLILMAGTGIEMGNKKLPGMKANTPFKLHSDWVTKLLFQSNSGTLITSSMDSTLRMVDLERKKTKWTVRIASRVDRSTGSFRRVCGCAGCAGVRFYSFSGNNVKARRLLFTFVFRTKAPLIVFCNSLGVNHTTVV